MSDELPKVDRLIRVYLKMKAKKVELDREVSDIEGQMEMIKRTLLDYCKETNQEGAKTEEGQFYRTTNTRYGSSDWGRLGEFVVANNVPDLYEKRLHQGNVKQFLDDNPDVAIPGLMADTKYTVTIKPPAKKRSA